ncbi:hypothetical protein HRR83_004882 [Exophiala dermatitidis]|uniref:Zn(2)-C6 fungal-type domain-containing protein n=2 Tax=Exophiala dermatitidis TaxID=5970 RepID=H6C3P5_EXODN|nr:uncharacterized protein HMPREF1120_06272 [Exophiala dermatitidis NIH/UT8656]KAJ4513953.1 hypothetical protein HRR75_004534 [Exophiala dermatitidis]EHY58260.1 hypothetical protein HMPREF1120_06272 [Exophiala dermatitidis NIH/UT8656]KAJ4517203.1 hypothetical protein HRR74_004953 [Exophiala dermatitidis]KAJ4519619.1 hypothetical protein HRR73_003679 [Exophiala dermatitidis]KAJ4541568.1 hypothetical protein HRR78_007452 [Exophiala dermatitidis]
MGDEGHDPVLAREDSHEADFRPGKRQRTFIARQACEACRAKKTRCDEDMPCSLCRTLGIECTYAERKPTKNEISMSMIFNTLKRMESKIDHLSDQDPPSKSRQQSVAILSEHDRHTTESPGRMESAMSIRSITSPQAPTPVPPTKLPGLLSFSAHQTVHWPGVVATLPPSLSSAAGNLEKSYPTLLESGRAQLSPMIPAQAGLTGEDWLASLSLSCVKELSNAYFDTFNRVYPCIDRDFYFLSTLAVVVREGFGYDMESCLVLNVMALGCMGLKAYEEGGFDTSLTESLSPIIRHIIDEEIPGLSFFNEARKRVGFCLCERDIQSCQYYLVSAVFFAQTMRPVDEWMMTNRAAMTCTAFFKCPPMPHDEWSADMQSRLFWTALVLETVIVQELELPPSRLKEFEDVVPLPKFITYPYADKSRPWNSDDSYYHYHFLAQIAHRIILSRIREELYYSNPSAALADELRHQLEQWRENLPPGLQWTSEGEDQVFGSPADAVVLTLLQARYRISRFHLGRPFLYKAIQKPMSVSDTDLKMCSEALQFAMDWPLALDVCVRMKDFMPLKYFVSGQMFGQLFIFHAFKNSPNPRVRDTLPLGYDVWCTKMLRFMSELVALSPTVAQDFELLSTLYHLAEV